jgi:hypothetical protein
MEDIKEERTTPKKMEAAQMIVRRLFRHIFRQASLM